MNFSTNPYLKQFILGMVLFVITLTISVIVTRLMPWYNNWDNIILLLPIFPGIYAGLSLARGIMTLDELQQRIHLEAFAFSLANTAFVAFLLGLLQANTDMNLNFIWVIPIMSGFWGLGLWIAQRRYQ